MSPDSFPSRAWRELKRRRILSVFAWYPAGAWFVIESVPTILSNLGADPVAAEKVGATVTILAIAAFPLVLLLTWMFQVVPDAQASPDPAQGSPRGRLFLAFSVVLVSAGCVTLATLLWPPIPPVLAAQQWAGRPVDEGALALLAPQLLLGDEDARHVADCIVHRLGDRLAATPGLRVRGPAETAALDGDGEAYEKVADRLGVGTLIASTAEQTEDTLRVTLRLLDGATGTQLESVVAVGTLPPDNARINVLVDSLEVGVRLALGRLLQGWETPSPSRVPASQERLQEAMDEWILYRRHLAEQDTDAALRSLGRVDSLLALASEADATWAEPYLRRSEAARDRALLLLPLDRTRALRSLATSRSHADLALARSPGNPEALRLRALSAFDLATADTSEAADRAVLLASADADLRRSQSRHRNRAEVRYDLALVKKAQGLLSDALLVAEDAYAYDAFLEVSDRLLWELFDLSFQLSRDDDAGHWCQEGRRRYPERWTFAACQLTLMGWGALPADTTLAGALTEDALAHYPPTFRGGLRSNLETLAAAVHVQAGDTAGARGLLALTTRSAPPGVRVTAAGVWLLLGERGQALEQLRAYRREAPGNAALLSELRILAPLQADPDFRRLVAERG